MAAFKDEKTGQWEVLCYYKDYTGKRKQKHKRGFLKKRDAQEWERNFKLQQDSNLDMKFGEFVELYMNYEESRTKHSSFATKTHMVEKKILPYFKNKNIREITASDIIQWQDEIMKMKDNRTGKPLSQPYLRTIYAQISAIFNHAVRMYGLSNNPAKQAGGMGGDSDEEMRFWTTEEYRRFSDVVADKPRSFYAFEILYWCGIRKGELMALTKKDFDFDKKELSITKTYSKEKGIEYLTTPKTKKSNRKVIMPEFICDEMKMYFKSLYRYRPTDRIFTFSQSYLGHEMDRACPIANVERIRVHDLRHSHVSLLIHLGYNAVAIAKRVGHETERITYRYAHLFPTVQTEMAAKLDDEREGMLNVGEK